MLKKAKKIKDEQKLEHLIEETLLEAYSDSECDTTTHKNASRVIEKNKDGFLPVLDKKAYLDIINMVLDPETGVGISDMGLIYNVEEFSGGIVLVTMTLTSLGCPAGTQITSEIESIIRLHKHVTDVKIDLVWNPPWKIEMMNPEIKAMLFGNRNLL